MSCELRNAEVIERISERSFIVDLKALQDKNGEIMKGGSTFINSILLYTRGKVFFISSGTESKKEIFDWLDNWRVTSNRLFFHEQAWGSDMPCNELISGLANSTGKFVLITASEKFERKIITRSPNIKPMRVDAQAEGFSYNKQWMLFHNSDFWD